MRRTLCLFGATVALAACTRTTSTPAAADEPTTLPPDTQVCGSAEEQETRGEENPLLCEPKVVRSANGQLNTTLAMRYAANQIADIPTCLRSYNGGLVGPTLRVRPGDVMNITVDNDLPETPGSSPGSGGHGSHGGGDDANDVNVPHAFNVSNLHTHGLHVSPAGNADNVMLSLYPGDAFENEIPIPGPRPDGTPGHAPGTHWYHAHHHGSVALQVAGGFAGALIVEGGLDDVLARKYDNKMRERLLIVQQPVFKRQGDGDGSDYSADACIEQENPGKQVNVATEYCGYADADGVGCIESYDFGTYGTDNPTINGQPTPTIPGTAGEVQRLRIVHGGIRGTLNLVLVPEDAFDAIPQKLATGQELKSVFQLDAVPVVPLNIVAEDGIAYGSIVEYDTINMDSGYRLDALVKFPQPGRYVLVDAPSQAVRSLLAVDEVKSKLAVFDVAAGSEDWPLPTDAELKDLAPYAPIENSELNEQDPCIKLVYDSSSIFKINGRLYDPADPSCRVPLGSAQEWRLSATFGNHPHHIHTNPFWIAKPPDGRRKTAVWKDTWLLLGPTDEAPEPEPTVVRTRYQRYIGDFVLHCHILNHEDQGMMQEVSIEQHPPKANMCIPRPGIPITTGTLCLRCDGEYEQDSCAEATHH